MEDRLISKINQECGNQTKPGCEIALKAVTPFEWDKLYFFGAWTTPDSIAEIIGFAYEGDAVPDDYRRILFVQGTKVVYQEDFMPLNYYSSTIDFPEMSDSLAQVKTPFLTPDNALFIVDKEKVEDACKECFFYSLSIKK